MELAIRQGIRLGELLHDLVLPADMQSVVVRGLTQDSREVREGDAFIAKAGLKRHGRDFVDLAVKKGAVAILLEDQKQATGWIEGVDRPVAVVMLNGLSKDISRIASWFYDEPSQKMALFGITGTNGKSTTASLIAQLHEALGRKSASIGTLGVVSAGDVIADASMTTPDAVTCQKWLAGLYEQQVSTVAMEVSSHALDQFRVSGIRFQTAVFTNLSRDHLDYHQDMQQYALAKQSLFAMPGLTRAVINIDDEYAGPMLEAVSPSVQIIRYGMSNCEADFHASNLCFRSDGVVFVLRSPWGEMQIESPLLCEFNVLNLIAAMASVCTTDVEFAQVVKSVPKLKPVAGRMQTVADAGSDLTVVVDYAHTPDALHQAICGLRKHTHGQLHVVFGCGGDRDAGKRPLMGKIAEELSDTVCITSDNPRTEDPHKIISEICKGITGNQFEISPDREQAITDVIRNAKPGDAILVAGKGHEKYQIIGENKFPFDDCAVAQQALRRRLTDAGRA